MLFAANIPPRVSPAKSAQARLLLERAVGESKVLSHAEACARFARDDSEAPETLPDAVVLAENAADILAALRVARECDVPITPRAAGTGRTGGAVPVSGGIVLATLGMNNIKEIDKKEGIAVVGPGVILADFQNAVEAEGWFYPPDPNSLASCALGGNVAENAGGPRAFKYGVTRDYVLGLETFLIGGARINAGRRTLKGVTGYDITALLVGSEGTLGVFGDITLKLIPKPEHVVTLMALFSSVDAAGKAVAGITARRQRPRCIELLDGTTLEVMRRAGNALNPAAAALLLIETDGSESEALRQAELIGEACSDADALEVLVAQNANQRDKLWSARREMSHAIRKLKRHKLSEDIVVPRQKIPELLSRVAEHAEREHVTTLSYGHAGDGNLHVNFLWDDAPEIPSVNRCIRQLFQDTVALGGTLSGEHGIGMLKAPYLPLEQAPELIALQQNLKHVFDPQGLLNPGKIFPAQHPAC